MVEQQPTLLGSAGADSVVPSNLGALVREKLIAARTGLSESRALMGAECRGLMAVNDAVIRARSEGVDVPSELTTIVAANTSLLLQTQTEIVELMNKINDVAESLVRAEFRAVESLCAKVDSPTSRPPTVYDNGLFHLEALDIRGAKRIWQDAASRGGCAEAVLATALVQDIRGL
jgi:hypothetical protein